MIELMIQKTGVSLGYHQTKNWSETPRYFYNVLKIYFKKIKTSTAMAQE